MKCPFCSSDNTRVIDSRPADDNSSIRRRRLCDDCGKRFTTYEKVETIPLIVIKKDNNREQYDRSKIEKGVLLACHKRPISADTISKLVDEVEIEIFAREEKEISTSLIGELIMDRLKDLDAVAYVRFASVYREFKDVNTFMTELKKMLELGIEIDMSLPELTFDESEVLQPLPAKADVYAKAISWLPELKSLGIEGDISELDEKIAKSGYAPTISLNGSVSTSNGSGTGYSFGNQLLNGLNEHIGVTLSVPIFDNKTNIFGLSNDNINVVYDEDYVYDEVKDMYKNLHYTQNQYNPCYF